MLPLLSLPAQSKFAICSRVNKGSVKSTILNPLCPTWYFLSGSVGEKFPGQMGSLEFFMALPDKIFCLGLSSHSWPSGKFVYARYARYTNSNALLWLRLSSIDVFCPHFVRAKNRPSGLKRLSSPTQILFSLPYRNSDLSFVRSS